MQSDRPTGEQHYAAIKFLDQSLHAAELEQDALNAKLVEAIKKCADSFDALRELGPRVDRIAETIASVKRQLQEHKDLLSGLQTVEVVQ